ncbi:cobalt transporter CbiM [Phormidium yuhuli AB48]|uniref:Cobalt transporter CbiM n=1 Tax=Phormidium yuhuli AB48 TaxID=2940671 RepID=A0ABY5ALC0_9CYAN|nr:cobalt transporter CbiM [Phormidium yuhuli]USR89731.1 cobalt transporter CbiM [Phormidium yuhuli AB48]
MHIADGFLPAPVSIAGYALTGGGLWFSLRQISRTYENPQEHIPKTSLLTAAFFVGSLINVPIPPSSVHLLLNGVLGVLLGYYAFPAIVVGLFFQAVMFQHGGLSTLGVNAAMLAFPALLSGSLFKYRLLLGGDTRRRLGLVAFVAGGVGVALSTLIFFGLIVTTIPADFDADLERSATLVLMISQIPLIFIEGAFTSMLVLFLKQVKPGLIEGF